MQHMIESSGKISIVGTPIGNLGDLSPRALQTLREADAVYAEDTRVTGKLLAAFQVQSRLERLDENTMGARAREVAGRAAAGERIAYCSDAGMPGVSDPGLRLVDEAYRQGVHVEVVPGPTAVATAYVASGARCPRFYFGGFFPRKAVERARLLESLRALDAALIFYESPNRLVSALEAVAQAFPARQVAVCRELTKLHEEVVRGTAAEVGGMFAARGTVKGEIVMVIDAADGAEGALDMRAAQQRARELVAEGLRTKEAVRLLAAELGMARNDAYELVVKVASDGA